MPYTCFTVDKAVVERIRALGADYAALDALIQTPRFLDLIERITGIPALRYDPHYFGCFPGHQTADGL